MTVLTLASPRPRRAVIDWYRKKWTNLHGEPRYLVYPVGPWKVIAHKEGSCFFTVQLGRARFGSRGFLGVSNTADVRPLRRPPAVFAPAGARILLHDSSDDGGKIGRTWVLTTHGSLIAAVRHYTHGLKRAGWSVVQAVRGRAPDGRRTAVMDFQKGRRFLHCVVEKGSSGGTTSIVLTEVIRP